MRVQVVAAALLLVASLVVGAAAAEEPPCNYIIQSGDSLYAIASKYGLKQDEVEAANPDIADITLIQPGDVVALPCAGNATEGSTIFDLLAKRSDMTVLFRAVVAGGFVDTLNDTKLVATLFAPNDTAWDKLLNRVNLTAADLLADKELLNTVLEYHLVPEVAAKAEDLKNGQNLTTALEGEDLVVYKPKKVLRLSTTSGKKVRVEETDLKAGKALVHTVRNVLWPANSLVELPEPSGDCIYTVKTGDVLFDIATEAGTTVDALIDLNPNLEADNGQSLQPGMELVLFPSCAV